MGGGWVSDEPDAHEERHAGFVFAVCRDQHVCSQLFDQLAILVLNYWIQPLF